MDLSLYGFQGLSKSYYLHPAFVHFPIALLPVTLFLYGAGLLFKKPSLLLSGRVCLGLTLVAVVVAAVTGLIAQNTVPHNEMIHHMMDTHRVTGLILLGITAVLLVWSFWHAEQRPKGAAGFLLVLAFGCYVALQNGDLGSRMVYQEGAGVKPAESVIGVEHHEHGHGEDEHQEHAGTNTMTH